MCARKVHSHFTIYHLPCNQNRVRVTSELHRSYLGVVFPHASHGVIFARSWSGNKKKLTVVREPVASFVVLSKFRIRLSKKTAMRSVLHSCGMLFICRDSGPRSRTLMDNLS